MYRILALVSLFLFLVPASLFAANATLPTDTAAYAMDTLVVTAGRTSEELREVPQHMVVIRQEEIRRSSARDLGDLLAERGIGHIQKTPGTLTSVGIRGFRTEATGNDLKAHVLVLLNGRRAGTGNLAKILTKNIERIEIIRGPGSVQYGSAAVGGVINVITRQGGEDTSLFAETLLGSDDYQEGSVGTSGVIGPVDFALTVTHAAREEYETGDGETYRNTKFDRKRHISLHLGLSPVPEHRFSGIFTQFEGNGIGTPSYLSQNDADDSKDSLNRSFDLIYEGGTNDRRYSWLARYFEGVDRDDFYFPAGSDPDGFDAFSAPYFLENEFRGGQIQATADHGLFALTGGVDWVRFEQLSTFDPKETEHDNPALFLLTKLRLLQERLVVTGGLRYDSYEVEVIDPAGNTEQDHHLSPSLGLAYTLCESVKLRANFGSAFVMPAPDQLAADFMLFGTHYQGNPDLDPETSRTYEAGVDVFRGPLEASATFFHTDFTDKIVRTSAPGPVSTWENLGGATIQGLEGSLSYDLGAHLPLDLEVRPRMSVVYLTRLEDEETGDDLLYTSDLHLAGGLTVADDHGFAADLSFAYTGPQDVEDFESGIFPAPVTRLGGFTVANLTLSKRFAVHPDFGDLTLRGEVRNLTDKKYEYVKGYPMPGTSYFVGVRWDFL